VPGVDAGSVSITKNGDVASCSPTDVAVAELDALQSRLGEGPCISAILDPPEDGLIVAGDLAGADGGRWPRFAPAAAAAGYRSMMSAEVSADGRMRASLNLYAHLPHAFDGEARVTAGLFAVQAAMLLYGSEQALHLQRALETRDAIGQAKGILRERFGVSDDRAFQMLVTSSQETNIKLIDVVRWLLDEVDQGRRVADDDLAADLAADPAGSPGR
jgi:hypothetical protein